ncbi:MAG TPA: GWxTD domain-containing protein [Pyrinomonadaceae bacterium]|nr:GWxTD domain-containing protein [Pyrinomonadaceae bacterium]
MARHKWMRTLASALILFSLCAPFAPAALGQKDDKKKSGQEGEVMDRQRNVRKEVKEVYKKWLEQDVAYIITDEERKAWKRLQTDEEREMFIEDFWRKRDPDPDTDENEYREEYFERIAYANQHFASGIPGWRTDRGRIWIMFGKPDERETHPSGGQYERPFWHGGGSTSTHPFEVWFYRYIPGVGSGVEIEFVDPTGSGEYRIARSPDEKDALLMIPGAGLTLSEQLGLSSKVDRVTGMGGFGYSGPGGRMQDSPFEWLARNAALNRPPEIQGVSESGNPFGTTGGGVVEDNPLDFDVRVDFFRQSEDRVVTAFTIQVENKDLSFKDVGGVQTARANIFGRITSVAGRRISTFEDPVTATATVEELAARKDQKSAYQKAVPLPPGTYKLDVMVRDINSGATQVKPVGFTVPRYDQKLLSTSTIVLAAKLQGLGDRPAVGQFTIGQFKVIPNVSGEFTRGQDVGIYVQVYNAGIDQTTLRPSVDVEYALVRDGKDIFRQKEDWSGLSDSGQRLTLARLLPTQELAPGEYEIVVRIRDHVSGQSLQPSAKFQLLANK